MAGKRQDPIPRFWAKVEKTDDCWNWTAKLNDSGYGRFAVYPGLQVRAHRYSYELNVGEIPKGLELDHLCRNRKCVNPAHLEPVTRRENLIRGDTFAARNVVKTHCPRGHEYTPANTMRVGARGRKCRECHRLYCALYQKKPACLV